MSPEERELLEKTAALAEDNNKMLRSIRRSMFWSQVMSVIYWVIIIGSAIGAYYIIQPYIDQMIGIYGNVKGDLDSVGDLIKNIKN